MDIMGAGYVLFLILYRLAETQAEDVFAAIAKRTYRGQYEGQCEEDGYYQLDQGSYVVCTNGRSYTQQCPAGTRNSGRKRFQQGGTFLLDGLCDENIGKVEDAGGKKVQTDKKPVLKQAQVPTYGPVGRYHSYTGHSNRRHNNGPYGGLYGSSNTHHVHGITGNDYIPIRYGNTNHFGDSLNHPYIAFDPYHHSDNKVYHDDGLLGYNVDAGFGYSGPVPYKAEVVNYHYGYQNTYGDYHK